MKKILILGGSFAQLPFIVEAKKRGYYTILVDYLDDNPSQVYADEYYNLSTTDKEDVLKLAKKIKPDIVYSYASDPAAPTVAYVTDKLGLDYSNSPDSVNILGEKNKFKEFLQVNGFNVPKFTTIKLDNTFNSEVLKQFRLPFFIKPTDSSGSKGVTLVNKYEDIQKAIDSALDFSRNKILIAEEYIDTNWQQIHGDIFVEEGKIIFSHLGDHHFDINEQSFVPYSTSWPSVYTKEDIDKVNTEIQKVLNLLDYRNGAINVEARIRDDKVYLMELGPRNGGNYVPLISKIATGFDMIDALFNQFMGIKNPPSFSDSKYSCYYVLRSYMSGNFKSIEYSSKIKKNINKKFLYKEIGDKVNPFTGANEAIGILLMTFENRQEMNDFYDNAEELIKIEVA